MRMEMLYNRTKVLKRFVMPKKYDFATILDTLREVESHLDMRPDGQPGPFNPLELFETLPADALLFGFASDGLPLLLNLRNSTSGPVLVTGDQGCGKTDFLKKLVLSSQRLMPPGEIQFTVLTDFPNEWAKISAPDHLIGVWPIAESVSTDLLYQLDVRVKTPDENVATVFLFDGLDAVLGMESYAQDYLANILIDGPRSLIWPVVTVNAGVALDLPYWLSFFETRIFGNISNADIARQLTSYPGAPVGNLSSNSQFCLRESSHWLKFWLPSLHE
jgi:hypothetical protein